MHILVFGKAVFEALLYVIYGVLKSGHSPIWKECATHAGEATQLGARLSGHHGGVMRETRFLFHPGLDRRDLISTG